VQDDIYVGPPYFFLDPAVPPNFLNSRIATGCDQDVKVVLCETFERRMSDRCGVRCKKEEMLLQPLRRCALNV